MSAKNIYINDRLVRYFLNRSPLKPILLIILTLMPSIALSEMKEFVRDYTFTAGEADSKLSSRRLALRAVREELLGEIGTYIYSEMNITQKDDGSDDITEHEVKALTAGFIKVETLEEKWNGYEFYIKARLYTDVDRVLREVNNLQKQDEENRQQKAALIEAQDRNIALGKKIAQLQQALIDSADKKPKVVEQLIAHYDEAQFELTAIELYEKGNQFYFQENPDYKKAAKWYRLAADQGDPIAQYNLGIMYNEGQGVKQSDTTAVKWYRLAADQGDSIAQSSLGFMYAEGLGVNQSDTTAIKWYRLAADQGDAWGQYNLGIMYNEGQGVKQSDTTAVKWWLLAADQGHVWAQFNLGTMHSEGLGVHQSDTTAVKWYQLAADLGSSKAQISLGFMYSRGRGVKQSDTTAVKWYRLAVDQGNAIAQYNLGVMYSEGRGVKQNDTTAVKWWRLAADQGNAIAQYNLGAIYAEGRGVKQNDAMALKWYQLAADQGVAEAQEELARLSRGQNN